MTTCTPIRKRGQKIATPRFSVAADNILSIPIVGWIYNKIFNPITYFTLDTALMFQESIGRAVDGVIGGLLNEQGLRALTDDQMRPTIRDLAK